MKANKTVAIEDGLDYCSIININGTSEYPIGKQE